MRAALLVLLCSSAAALAQEAADSLDVSQLPDPFHAELQPDSLAVPAVTRPVPSPTLPRIELLVYLEVEGKPPLAIIDVDGQRQVVEPGDRVWVQRRGEPFELFVEELAEGRLVFSAPGLLQPLEIR